MSPGVTPGRGTAGHIPARPRGGHCTTAGQSLQCRRKHRPPRGPRLRPLRASHGRSHRTDIMRRTPVFALAAALALLLVLPAPARAQVGELIWEENFNDLANWLKLTGNGSWG